MEICSSRLAPNIDIITAMMNAEIQPGIWGQVETMLIGRQMKHASKLADWQSP